MSTPVGNNMGRSTCGFARQLFSQWTSRRYKWTMGICTRDFMLTNMSVWLSVTRVPGSQLFECSFLLSYPTTVGGLGHYNFFSILWARHTDSQADVKVECYCKSGEDWDYNKCCFTPDRREPFQTTCIPQACDADIELLKLRFSRGIDGLMFCPDKPGTVDFDLGDCRNDTVPSTDDFEALICPSDAYWQMPDDERLNGKVMPGSTCFLSCSAELELARDQRALDGITVSKRLKQFHFYCFCQS